MFLLPLVERLVSSGSQIGQPRVLGITDDTARQILGRKEVSGNTNCKRQYSALPDKRSFREEAASPGSLPNRQQTENAYRQSVLLADLLGKIRTSRAASRSAKVLLQPMKSWQDSGGNGRASVNAHAGE